MVDLILRFLMAIARAFGVVPPAPPVTPPVDPPVTPPVTPPATPPVTPAPRAITAQHDFRTLPPISAAQLAHILRTYPLGAEAEAIHTAVRGNPLPVAQTWPESRYGQDDNAQATHNPLGLLWDATWAPGPYLNVGANGVTVPLLTFDTWAEAFAEWQRRTDDAGYKGGVYPAGMTLEAYVFTYVGGPGCLSRAECGNGETPESCRRYLDETVARLNRYYGVEDVPAPPPAPDPAPSRGKPYAVPGLGTIYLPFPLEVHLIPPAQTNQRPGFPLTVDRYVQHETGNHTIGANADAHRRYLETGALDRFGRSQQLSYHLTVDDKKAICLIPLDEGAWHGGDGNGPCNYHGIACELCVNADIDVAKSREYAAILAAEVMNALGRDIALQPHVTCQGTDHYCPEGLLNQPGGFQAFANRVTVLRKERAA